MTDPVRLACGVPTQARYRDLLESPDFKDLETFSRGFLLRNRAALKGYSRRWSSDPLHHWSRQWEYPFVLQWLDWALHAASQGEARILDAGSGVTFFPYFLADRFPKAELVCLDMDRRLEFAHARIVEPSRGRVCFRTGGIQSMAEGDGAFDSVYCISVLEHTEDHERVIREFRRVLKPGGLLVVTFDISLDGEARVPVDVAESLLALLKFHFEPCEPCPGARESLSDDVVTTAFIRDSGLATRPWRHPWMSAMRDLLRGRRPRRLFKDLTFYCAAFRRV
ncbi:MAG: class I SAM-dependent methyltransferase [Candidatus Omnitrophica bacterium]|nr:Ubiquinone biosynthesis O-methyltransferase [bacterium]NUN95550.1 class I SAM-dependent methyltransferase [Candidatus Omnitrophota bacterium]